MRDILVKRYNEISTVWISQNWLLERCGEMLNADKMRTHARFYYKKNGVTWEWQKEQGRYYYNYDRIPEKYQIKIGSREEIISMEGENMSNEEIRKRAIEKLEMIYREEYKVSNIEAVRWYSESGYAQEAVELSESWTWAKVVLDYTDNDRRWWVKLGFEKKMMVYECVVEILKERELPGMKVKTTISLMNKVKGYRELGLEESYRYFVHGNMGNENRTVINEEVKALLIYLRGLPQNFSDRSIIRKVQALGSRMGSEIPSDRTIERFFSQKYIKAITEVGRYGEGGRYLKWNNASLPMALPLYAGACWQLDGTRVNMAAHRTRDEKGRLDKDKFLYIVAVRDVYSGAILGWSYCYSESASVYLNAVYMAFKRVGYMPYEMVYDRFPGHEHKIWKSFRREIEKVGVKNTIVHTAQGKAQIERAFGTLQSIVMSDSVWYYGEGVKSKREHAHRSPEYLKEMKKLVRQLDWDWDKACAEMDKVIDKYNNTKLSEYSKKKIDKSPVELLQDKDDEGVIMLSNEKRLWLFGVKSSLSIKAGGMIRTEVGGVEKYYRVENENVLKHIEKAVLAIDVEDNTKALMYGEEGDLLAVPSYMPKLQRYGKKAEKGRIMTERAKNRKIKQMYALEYEDKKTIALKEYGDEMQLIMGQYTNKEIAEREESKYLENTKELMSVCETDEEEPKLLTQQEKEKALRSLYFNN